ncbi:MAG: hypothetical protein WD851_02115 [Pirellulales bacterium]
MTKLHGLLALIVLAGCSQPSDFVEATGTVHWNGAPMPSGMIVLQPIDPSQTPAGGIIEEGQFQLRTKPGKMRVQIEAVRATTERDPETGTPMGEMYVPARYNTQTELEADVTREGDNRFEFSLTDQREP